MKANELMIGDWVTHSEYGDKKVLGLDYYPFENSNLICVQHEECYRFEDQESFTPIPLTAEILEKNGLGSKQQDTPMVSLHIYGDGWDNKSYGYIKYVHQLQQALRHCGLNDLADNFKV